MSGGKVLTFRIPVTVPTKEHVDVNAPIDNHSSYAVQRTLFALSRVILLFQVGERTGALLPEVLSELQPAWIVDFRPVPRFDFGSFDRAKFFSLLEKYRSEYWETEVGNSLFWSKLLTNKLKTSDGRPLLFLTNPATSPIEEEVARVIAKHSGWSIGRINEPEEFNRELRAAGL